MSSQKSSSPITSNEIVDYWPSWVDWNRTKLKEYLPGGNHERVDIINICFAIPQADGTLNWNDKRTDADDPTKEIIKQLRAAGKRVLIAIGGASDRGSDINWNLKEKNIKETLAKNIKKMVDEYGCDGLDIDYEEQKKLEELAEITPLIKELRKIMPMGKYWISYAAWSIGAYGKNNPKHEHPEWNGSQNIGRDVKILKESGPLLDHVFVMAYDAFEKSIHPNYNPIEAINAFRALLNGRADKIVLGIELGNHAWPANVRTSTNTVRPWMEYAAQNGFRGAGFWTLDADKIANTGEKSGAFIELTNQIMPRKGVTKAAVSQDKDKDSRGDYKANVENQINTDFQANRNKQANADYKTNADYKMNAEDQTSIKRSPKPIDAEKNRLYQDLLKHHAKDELIKMLNIKELDENAQQQVLKVYEKQQNDLKNLYDQHQVIRNEREKSFTKADPSQKESLKQQFLVHDTQLNNHLKEVEKTFRSQLETLIQQLRSSARPRNTP